MGFLAGRHVLVAGAGVTGRSAAEALLAADAVVTVTDGSADNLAALEQLLPGVTLVRGLAVPPPGTDLVVTSPGWRPSSPLLVAAAAAGVEVIGEVELAWRMGLELADPPTWLAVTGTNGKTTTVGMLESILRAAGLDAVACGNVGLPVVDALLAGRRVLAVELSSFQLHWSPSVRPFAGVLLNLAEDHLDWHGTFEAYAAAKAGVLTGEVGIGGVDDPVVARLLTRSPARAHVGFTLGSPEEGQLGVHDGQLVDRAFGASDTVLLPAADVRPGGPPGIADALAAAALARAHGVPASAVARGLREFRPGAHRAVLVATVGGVSYVNDSKATNPHAAAASLRSHESVVWVAGGLLKGASVDELVRSEGHRLRGAVLIGTDREVIASALARHAPSVPVAVLEGADAADMENAVRAARSMAQPGDAVVLAPAAASMDMFSDYAHRGQAFTGAVLKLTEQG